MHIRPICLGFIAAGWLASARQCVPASQLLSSTTATSSSSSGISVTSSTGTTADSSTSATTIFTTSTSSITSTANPTSSSSSSGSTTTSTESVTSTTSDITTESTTSALVDTTTSTTLASSTGADSTTSTTSTSSSTSTSAVPTLSSFIITASSPGNPAANGSPLTSYDSQDFALFLPTNPNFQAHPFYLEDGTNKLMTNGMYLIWYQFSREIFVISPSDLARALEVSSTSVSKFTCDGAYAGQPLSCTMDLYPSQNQILIEATATSDVAMVIFLDTDSPQSSEGMVVVDFIAGEV